MAEKVLESLDQFRYVLQAVAMLGVLALLAKAYGIGVEKEGFNFKTAYITAKNIEKKGIAKRDIAREISKNKAIKR